MTPVSSILVREETLDPAYLPARLVRRDAELELLRRRYREALGKGLPFHLLLTGGVGAARPPSPAGSRPTSSAGVDSAAFP